MRGCLPNTPLGTPGGEAAEEAVAKGVVLARMDCEIPDILITKPNVNV